MLKLVAFSSRRPDVATEEIVLGLTNGGLCGSGLSIAHRDKEHIIFKSNAPLLERVPNRGQIDVSKTQDGRTEVRLSLVTTNLTLRAMSWGLVVALATVFQLGWAIGWQLAGGAFVGVALVVGVFQWRREMRRLANQARGYIENARFIKYQ